MNKKAFTLIEMLIVVMIIGILSSFVLIQINSSINEGKDVKRKADIELLANAVVSYSSDHYSSKPITDFDGCQIGVDCGTEVESSLKAYLPTLPNDPNSDTSYIYQSNGNDCTISATLSNGEVYQYSCTNDATTTGTPVTGVCGTAANTYDPGTTTFVGDFCASGNTNPTTPVFPSVDGTTVSWECSGEHLGDSTTCTAYRGADGVCGSVITTTATAYLPSVTTWPSSDYCSTGTTTTPTFPAQGGSTTWSCFPLYAGDTASCTAYRGQNGVCGTANGEAYSSAPTSNLCEVTGVAPIVSVSDPWTWTCTGINNGNSMDCSATLSGYSFSATAGTGGTVSCKYTLDGTSMPCLGNYPSNTSITITGTGTGNYLFKNWLCSGSACSSTTSSSTVVVLSGATTVNAIFVAYSNPTASQGPTLSGSTWIPNPSYQGASCGQYASTQQANNLYCPTGTGTNLWSCAGYTNTWSYEGQNSYQGACCPYGTHGLTTSITYRYNGYNSTIVCVPN